MSAATHDLYELANAYANARATHETRWPEYYVWMETSLDVRVLKTKRLSGQHIRFQERSTEYPIPVSRSELDSAARGYLEIRHSDSTVLVGYSPYTTVWFVGEKLRNLIHKLWPKYVITQET